MIPLDAIVRATDGSFAVYTTQKTADATTVKLTNIETGEVVGNEVIVTSGLNAGDEVVVAGTAQVTDGQIVNVLR